jgi:regulator of sirC expression with transglutaminase-like and TPR domain
VVDEPEARARFAELMSKDEAAIWLDEAALAIAQGEYTQLDPSLYLRRLDEMAEQLRPRLSAEEAPARLVADVNAYLFGEQAFHGNGLDYYDPRNSYLSDVLDRRTGIPITLSLVYMELGRRVRLPIEGVGLPGHFVVRFSSGAEPVLVDPFNEGQVLSVEDCAKRVRLLYGTGVHFSPELLRPASKREIITRMLGNLKGSYLRRGDYARALRAVEWCLLADPTHSEDFREKGLLRAHLGDLRGAASDLERYLESAPEGALVDQTREQLRLVRDLWTRRN